MSKLGSAFFGLLVAICLMVPVSVQAQTDPFYDVCSGPRADSAVCKKTTSSASENPVFGPNGVLTKVIQILVIIAGVASVIAIIIGGFKFILSSGDPNNIKSAKDTIIYAIVGLTITIIAQVIVTFVIMRL